MVNNATSINKTNNYFSPPIIECKKDYIPLEILDLAMDRHANVAG
jgi:phage-related protein